MSSERDKARYPFTNEAADFVKNLGIEIGDLIIEPYGAILKRAKQRIRQALLKPDELSPQEEDPNIEVPSFPTAIMLMAYSDSENSKRRYAVAESKSFSKKLKDEPPDKILRIAKETFSWKIRHLDEGGGQEGDFLLHFKNFLSNTCDLNELKWKLTNRALGSGYVRLTSDEASRLIEEEIQRKILQKTRRPTVEPPSVLQEAIKSIRELASSGSTYQTQAQTLGLEVADMPPCIKKLLDTLSSGGRLSHVGRFTLTSFLVNTSATEDEVVNFFKSASDFDERKTRYQVEHISGVRGGRTKYTPPKCDTLKTHGLCPGPDELCSKVRHPMMYYRRKRTIPRRKARTKSA
jgi:DNA primase large subunit